MIIRRIGNFEISGTEYELTQEYIRLGVQCCENCAKIANQREVQIALIEGYRKGLLVGNQPKKTDKKQKVRR